MRTHIHIALLLSLIPMMGVAQEPSSKIYFEAEWANRITLNYQIEDEGDRTILIADEGADGAFAWNRRPHSMMEVGTARYDLVVPKSGIYQLWALRYWMDSCGNSVGVAFNKEPFRIGSDASDEYPSRFGKWGWGVLSEHGLRAGSATLKLRVMEDGPRFDRFALLPLSAEPDDNEAAAAKPLFAEKTPVPFAMSVSLPSQVISPDNTLKLTACVRKLANGPGEGTISFYGPEGSRLANAPRAKGKPKVTFLMKEGQALARIPMAITLPEGLDQLEYRLQMLVTDKSGKVCALTTFNVANPPQWRLLGPLNHGDFLAAGWENGMALDLEQAVETTLDWKPVSVPWKPFPHEGYDKFATMDFERVWGKTRKPRAAYVYTKIDSASARDVLLLVNNDDRAWIWLNGELVFRDHTASPAIGGLIPKKVSLRKGTNVVLARIDQVIPYRTRRPANYWRLRIRFRDDDDRKRLARGIRGL